MSESVFRREKESGASPAAPSTGLVERHLSGALGDNVKSDTEIDLEDDHAPSHNRLVERMQGYLSSLGLSQFSSGVALGYLQSRLQEEGGPARFRHVISFFLARLNGERPSTSEDAVTWQKGCPNLFPTLTATPVWKEDVFNNVRNAEMASKLHSCISILEKEHAAILAEFHKMRDSPTAFQPYRSPPSAESANETDDLGQKATSTGDWNVAYLYLHGLDFSENMALCPRTAHILHNVLPRHYSHAFFSVLSPGAHVTPHYGPTNKKLRLHLPLIVPPEGKAWLRVANDVVVLERGKVVMFDDSHEHEAANDHLTHPRVVLVMDIWHPDLSDEEVKFLSFVNKGQVLAAKKLAAAAMTQGTECDDNFLSVIEKSRQHPVKLSGADVTQFDVRDD